MVKEQTTKKCKKPEKSKKKQDARFKPGESGNPNGRPRGSKNYKTLAFEERLESLGCDPVARRLQSQGILKHRLSVHL